MRPDEEMKELDALLSDVAGALYAVDSGGDLLFVRTQAEAGNQAAKAAAATVASAWEQYPLGKEAVDRLTAGLAAGDHAVVDEMLGPTAVTRPDGTAVALAPFLKGLKKQVDTVAAEVARMADTARRAVTQLDAARVEAQELLVRAGAVGAADDPELTALSAALEAATAAIATAPTDAPDLARVQSAMAAARARVAGLERARTGLPAELAAADARLDEIDRLVARAADARALAHEKIASPAGLLDAVDPGGRPLRPWLAQIRQQADGGAWDAAASALASWTQAADAMLASAQRVAAANAAPVARRNELRGLIDAYRAKALAYGRDEDGQLARMHAAAKEALYTAPCQLAEAERLVHDYIAAVNAAAGGREP